MIRTSYYSKVENFTGIVKIGIFRTSTYYVPTIEELYPTWDIINEYKQSGNVERFTSRYINEVLSNTSVDMVMSKIRRICAEQRSYNVVLLCYEGKGKFCHRLIVSEWLRADGYEVQEL